MNLEEKAEEKAEKKLEKKRAGRSRAGFSMLELLMVVGILAILSAVAFINVVQYQRSLEQLERDSVAKEIFVAAQNHLTMAFGAGYYGLGDAKYYGTQDENETDQEDGIYYIVYDHGISGDPKEMYDLMLPFGSIDETVRAGGSYLIRYQPKMGLVLDVFYCSTDARFGASVEESPFGYTALMEGYTGEENRPKRVHPEGGSRAVLGWYGGAQAKGLATMTLKAPKLSVLNGEKLVAVVTDSENGELSHVLKLIVTGELSGAQKEWELTSTKDNVEKVSESKYQVVLDDITNEHMHFCQLCSDFYPGENLHLQAVVYSEGALSNIPYSEEKIENSLFAAIQDTDGDAKYDQAMIANIRHLENLDEEISGMNPENITWSQNLSLTNALQVSNLVWGRSGSIFKATNTASGVEGTLIYSKANPETESWKGYYPVNPGYELVYDGDSHSISGVEMEEDFLYGGLFGNGSKIAEIKNLELIDFAVKADKQGENTPYAGALAGKLLNAKVINVIAHNSKERDHVPIKDATGTDAGGDSQEASRFSSSNRNVSCLEGVAGGLIGDAGESTIEDCGAAVFVKGSTAGGLLGTGKGPVLECYTGGHTKHGSYETDNFNVTGTEVAGGLVGIYSGTGVKDSYSTCSVKTGAEEAGALAAGTAGGFVGRLTSGQISNCYCTGLVKASTELTFPQPPRAYAFVGEGGASAPADGKKNYYYSIINEDLEVDDPYMPAQESAGDVLDMDQDAATLNAFLGNTRKPADAYDETLTRFYDGKFAMKTVEQLSQESGGENWDTYSTGEKKGYFVRTHYGDWPSAELFFFNEKSS